MKIIEIINNLNNLGKFVEKNYELPFILRRAIKKNHKALMEEYNIYDEQRKELLADIDNKTAEEKAEIDKKFREFLNTEIDLEIIKVDINVLADIKMPYKDELLIAFMMNEEE